MSKKYLKMAFVAVMAMMASYGVSNDQKSDDFSELMSANVEALADVSTDPDENGCIKSEDLCSVLVIYPDGIWGEEFFYDKQKAEGWI